MMKNRSIMHHHFARRHVAFRVSSRSGLTTPMVALVLLVAMGGLALILDRLWLSSADLELTAATEAAALAAARELASDETLRKKPDLKLVQQDARDAAAWAASQNLVAGDPVVVNSEPGADVRLGRIVLDPYQTEPRFEETDVLPTSVVVTASRSRGGNNPVGLFIAGVTGMPFGDVAARVEATVDNRVIGVRPYDGVPVPGIPLAIWWKDPEGKRRDTWQHQIEVRGGKDEFTFESRSGQVFEGPDGIPEMTLKSRGRNETSRQWGTSTEAQQSEGSNVLILDIGTHLADDKLTRQFETGWSAEDLEDFDGQLCVSPKSPEKLRSIAEMNHSDRTALEGLIGEPRICLLYSEAKTNNQSKVIDATCVKLVAIRILSVRDRKNGCCEVIVQPCVFATRTALLQESAPYYTGLATETDPASVNPYIYKLHLTH